MPVKSLKELAIMVIFKNIREVDNVGYLNYENVRHILLRVESGAQLRQIELNSPHLQGQTAEAWIRLIERDFPIEARNKPIRPKDPKKWYKVWEKYKADQDKFLRDSEDTLKAQISDWKKVKETNTSKIIELGAIPSSKKGAIRRPRARNASSLPSTGGSRTKAVNGTSVMRKVRREAKEITQIHGSLSQPVKAPTAPSTITKAPEAMVNDHKRAALPPYRPALLTEAKELERDLQLKYNGKPEALRNWQAETASKDYHSRSLVLSDSELSSDSADGQPEQSAPAAHKPTAAPKSTAARPAAPKVPTTSLKRKFGSSKSAFMAPAAPSAPVIKAREPMAKPKPEQQKPEHKSEQPDPKRPRLRAFPAPDLPTTQTTPCWEKGDEPENAWHVLFHADDEAERKLQEKAPATAARMAQIYRKRKTVDIFAHPKKRVH
jgi:elongin-A